MPEAVPLAELDETAIKSGFSAAQATVRLILTVVTIV